jgi:uroporphyrinogen-III synthase
LKLLAVGQGTARALHDLGILNILTPSDGFDSEALLALPELTHVADKKILIIRGDGGRPLLGDTLKSRGAQVHFAECYRRLPPPLPLSALIAAQPDALTVTSSEAVSYLHDLLNEQNKAPLQALPLFAPHPRIAAAAVHLGWSDVITTDSGDDGLLSGLVAWAQARKISP